MRYFHAESQDQLRRTCSRNGRIVVRSFQIGRKGREREGSEGSGEKNVDLSILSVATLKSADDVIGHSDV